MATPFAEHIVSCCFLKRKLVSSNRLLKAVDIYETTKFVINIYYCLFNTIILLINYAFTNPQTIFLMTRIGYSKWRQSLCLGIVFYHWVTLLRIDVICGDFHTQPQHKHTDPFLHISYQKKHLFFISLLVT